MHEKHVMTISRSGWDLEVLARFYRVGLGDQRCTEGLLRGYLISGPAYSGQLSNGADFSS